MIETATLITLCMLYLIFFRPGKTPPLENPLVIERPGQYQLTLAPQLNLAQPFAEAIANAVSELQMGDGHTFKVCDNQVESHGCHFYLLRIGRRDGMICIQADRPMLPEADYRTADVQEDKLTELVLREAKHRGIQISRLAN
jgi:hypothetical protein